MGQKEPNQAGRRYDGKVHSPRPKEAEKPPAPPGPPLKTDGVSDRTVGRVLSDLRSTRGQKGVKIITPGNGGGPFCGQGTKVVDLETGKEILDVQEIHVHISPNDVVRAEILLLPSEVEIKGAKATFTTAINVNRADVVRFLEVQASPHVLRKFNLVFPEPLVEVTTLADRWRRFKRRCRGQSKGDSPKC